MITYLNEDKCSETQFYRLSINVNCHEKAEEPQFDIHIELYENPSVPTINMATKYGCSIYTSSLALHEKKAR